MFFHLLCLFPLFLFFSLNLPARTITLSLDKQHFIESDTATILPSLRLACKTEYSAQTYQKKVSYRKEPLSETDAAFIFSFFSCSYVISLVLSSRKLDQTLTRATTTTPDLYSSLQKGLWLPSLVSFKSFQEWSYFTRLLFSQRKMRVICEYFVFQVFLTNSLRNFCKGF